MSKRMLSTSPASPASDGVNAVDHEVDSQDLGDISIEAVRNEEDYFDFEDNEEEEGGLEYLSFEYDKLMQQYPQRRNATRGKDAKKKLRLKHERAQGLHSSQDILLRDTCSRIPLGSKEITKRKKDVVRTVDSAVLTSVELVMEMDTINNTEMQSSFFY